MAVNTNSRLSTVDEYGFERPSEFDYETYEEFMSKYLSVLTRRAQKWSNLLGSKESVGRGFKVKRYVRKGIPMRHRGKMWATISGAAEYQKKSPNHYKDLLNGQLNTEVVDSIKTDVPRTFPDNIYFRDYTEGRLTHLHNVLVAFAHHNTNIGYCQGLNYIAGVLLIVVKDEELTFWLLVALIENLLPGYYGKNMTGILTDLKVLEVIVKEKSPLVWRHMKHEAVDWCLVATKWFVCLFAEVLPIETVLRIWDCLFYEGNKILMRVAIALIVTNQENILMCQDFGAIVDGYKAIAKNAQSVDCHTFMQTIFEATGKFPRAWLNKLREESLAEVLKEQAEVDAKKNSRKKNS